MDALPLQRVRSYHPPEATGSHTGQGVIRLQANMAVCWSPRHTQAHTHKPHAICVDFPYFHKLKMEPKLKNSTR